LNCLAEFTVLDVEVVRGFLRTMGQFGQPLLWRHLSYSDAKVCVVGSVSCGTLINTILLQQ
jgi:hypothetical protein